MTEPVVLRNIYGAVMALIDPKISDLSRAQKATIIAHLLAGEELNQRERADLHDLIDQHVTKPEPKWIEADTGVASLQPGDRVIDVHQQLRFSTSVKKVVTGYRVKRRNPAWKKD